MSRPCGHCGDTTGNAEFCSLTCADDEVNRLRYLLDIEKRGDAEVSRLTRELEEARSVLIRAQEDYRSAVEGLETYEERIGDIADHVLGLVPPGVPSIVKLDAIERRCGDERVAARQAEAKLEDARAVLREVEWAGRRDWNGYSGFPSCPCCEEYEPGYEGKRASTGHAPDCRLAKVLA